ncbi:hypothetical protein FSP39_024227 [Pinctada imbricata]|uniref:Uncharacterized protein n=1 Tax=Pinctada imbricata TaxID=66713 RepID=A0AA89BPY8_PINIB|nr:hypothetical protein FSP39_024227 [Pinctada imbricata]
MGLNYDGDYKEYAIVDHRLAMSVSVTHVAIRDPKVGQSDVLISAYDNCGRVCRPSCLQPGTQNLYKPCKGIIRVTSRSPKMYANDFGESIMDVWNFTEFRECPQFATDQIYVSFFCDYTDRYPWEAIIRQPGAQIGALTTKKRLQKCDLGLDRQKEQCFIRRKNCKAPCKHLEFYPCEGLCNKFARCFRGRYYIQQCYKARFNPKRKRCEWNQGVGPDRCPDKRWKVIRPPELERRSGK